MEPTPIPVDRYAEFSEIRSEFVFGVIVERYGRKLANELAAEVWRAHKQGNNPLLRNSLLPVWPAF